jgi:hypothetical protein
VVKTMSKSKNSQVKHQPMSPIPILIGREYEDENSNLLNLIY